MINCKMHNGKRCSPRCIGGPGSSYCVVSNNEVCSSPGSCGVGGYPCGDDNIFEWNDVHHISKDDDDAGALKACNAYNALMRHNRVHDNNRNPESRVPFYGPTADGQWKTCQGITGLYFDWSRDPEPLGGTHSFVEVPMSGFKPWTYEEPNLYTAGVQLKDGAKVLDAVTIRFAMREI